jgi:hypothetical protein
MLNVANVALAMLLDSTEVLTAKRREYRIVEISTGSSTTPLPPHLQIRMSGHSLTQAPSVHRDISSYLRKMDADLAAASILPINEEAQAIVSRILADNVRAPTSKRILKPRTK